MNNIVSLTRDDGMIATNYNDLCNDAKSYFGNLYCSFTVEINEVINHVLLYLLFNENSSLIAHFSIDGFKTAFFQIDSNKSLGPDSLMPTIYKFFGTYVTFIFSLQLYPS